MTSAFGDQKIPMMTSITNVGEGWHPLIKELEEKLNEIDPNFELQQVKEKFGGLRYYANTGVSSTVAALQFHELVSVAEGKSVLICEECGKPGETHPGTFGWLKTLCPDHQAERLAKDEEMKKEMEP